MTESASDAEDAIQKVNFPAVSGTNVAAPVDVNNPGPYQTTYTWGSGASRPGSAATPTITITNNAAGHQTSAGTFTLTPDATIPTGGALTVNGVAASSGGTTSTSTSASFPIDVRTNYAEAASPTESGLASSNLVRDRYPFANNACNFTTSDETIVTGSGTTNSGTAGGYCYVYTLTGIDNVGNSVSLKTTVKVIGAATTLVVSAPASVSAGSAFSATVTAVDAYGNTATGYTGTIGFASSDGAAVKPANYTFVGSDNGAHAFTNGFTLQNAGTQSISATDVGTPRSPAARTSRSTRPAPTTSPSCSSRRTRRQAQRSLRRSPCGSSTSSTIRRPRRRTSPSRSRRARETRARR